MKDYCGIDIENNKTDIKTDIKTWKNNIANRLNQH